MAGKIIRFCYRKIIDANCQKRWEKYVWEDTYQEFLLQVQNYEESEKCFLYSELIGRTPKAAIKLPFLVGTAAVGYLKQLNGIMPDVTSVLGKTILPFKNYKFEILESHATNKAIHKVAINFISEPMRWHDTINGTMLVSIEKTKENTDGAWLTEMIILQPQLSIFSLQEWM